MFLNLFISIHFFLFIFFQQLISALCEFTSEDSERQLLETFCSSAYENEIVIPHRSLWHILEKVPSCQPPLELILEHFPRLRPRPYSIASSSNYRQRNSNQFRVIFSLEELPENQTGLVSGWLVEIAKNIKNDDVSNCDLSLEKAMRKLNLGNNQVFFNNLNFLFFILNLFFISIFFFFFFLRFLCILEKFRNHFYFQKIFQRI